MYYADDLYDESLLIEDLLDDGYFEDDLLDDDLLDEDDFELEEEYGESFDERKPYRRNSRSRYNKFKRLSPRLSSRVKKRSNFGRRLPNKTGKYITKTDLKTALNAISKDVNGIKKSVISNGKTVKALDGKYATIVKDIARKDANQTKVLKNMQQMSMLSSLLNKPKFDESNLEVNIPQDGEGEVTVKEKVDNKTVNFDQTLSLLLPMLTTAGDSGTGKSSNDMMLPLILLMNNNNSGSSDTNAMLPILLLMMNK
ncbi:hypothetical protein NBT05_07585 [Aquimarina sp. ERC-38]|uniref:hypothetical protein n=1 Tax=Aquimarina sp. ERC-38 TaxID=2949996 RepID=UPI0022466CE5|nr:hypothetical protein [Aquimarina sp. ERC-38]UZO82327.1 hypothetical protein NBT05_07585 [Aquimarina sp. ERC-38]